MFKIIGAVVVYGLAAYGLTTFLQGRGLLADGDDE